MFQADYYSRDTKPPLRYVNGYPVYLATLIAGAHAVTALLDLLLGNTVQAALIYFPWAHQALEQPWRLVTWAFANDVSVWIVIGTFFTYTMGRRIEMWFGSRFFGVLYLALVLTGSATAFLLDRAGVAAGLSGDGVSVLFSLFMASCLLEPDAPFWGIEKLPVKVVGAVSLGLGLLGYIGKGDWGNVWILLSMLAVVYVFLRSTGMPGRFGRISTAFRKAMPSPGSPAGRTKGRAAQAPPPAEDPVPRRKKEPSRYYEPKIKPKPDLAPERKAVEDVDTILEKIGRSGMDSLSEEEKAALRKASAKLKDSND